MFTLFKSSPLIPKVKPVDLRFISLYLNKFDESLRNWEELQKDSTSAVR